MDFLLDPYVIAVPDSIATDAELTDYINTLKKWLLAPSMNKHNLWFTSYMTKSLNKENIFPYPSLISSRCSRDLNHKHRRDLQDVVQVIRKRLMQPPHLDKKFTLPEPDFDLIDSVVLPEEVEKRLSPYPDVAYALKKSLVAIGLESTKNGSEELQNVFFATKSVVASHVEVEINQLGNGGMDVERIAASWSMLTTPDQLDEVEELLDFWQDTSRALSWKLAQLRASGSIMKEVKCPALKAGLEFNNSIEANNPSRNPGLVDTTFRNILLAVCEAPGFQRHKAARGADKRINKHHRLLNAGDHITRHDGSTAWRVHLCGNHRLHYWLLPDGSIELSVITNDQHNDFYIA